MSTSPDKPSDGSVKNITPQTASTLVQQRLQQLIGGANNQPLTSNSNDATANVPLLSSAPVNRVRRNSAPKGSVSSLLSFWRDKEREQVSFNKGTSVNTATSQSSAANLSNQRMMEKIMLEREQAAQDQRLVRERRSIIMMREAQSKRSSVIVTGQPVPSATSALAGNVALQTSLALLAKAHEQQATQQLQLPTSLLSATPSGSPESALSTLPLPVTLPASASLFSPTAQLSCVSLASTVPLSPSPPEISAPYGYSSDASASGISFSPAACARTETNSDSGKSSAGTDSAPSVSLPPASENLSAATAPPAANSLPTAPETPFMRTVSEPGGQQQQQQQILANAPFPSSLFSLPPLTRTITDVTNNQQPELSPPTSVASGSSYLDGTPLEGTTGRVFSQSIAGTLNALPQQDSTVPASAAPFMPITSRYSVSISTLPVVSSLRPGDSSYSNMSSSLAGSSLLDGVPLDTLSRDEFSQSRPHGESLVGKPLNQPLAYSFPPLAVNAAAPPPLMREVTDLGASTAPGSEESNNNAAHANTSYPPAQSYPATTVATSMPPLLRREITDLGDEAQAQPERDHHENHHAASATTVSHPPAQSSLASTVATSMPPLLRREITDLGEEAHAQAQQDNHDDAGLYPRSRGPSVTAAPVVAVAAPSMGMPSLTRLQTDMAAQQQQQQQHQGGGSKRGSMVSTEPIPPTVTAVPTAVPNIPLLQRHVTDVGFEIAGEAVSPTATPQPTNVPANNSGLSRIKTEVAMPHHDDVDEHAKTRPMTPVETPTTAFANSVPVPLLNRVQTEIDLSHVSQEGDLVSVKFTPGNNQAVQQPTNPLQFPPMLVRVQTEMDMSQANVVPHDTVPQEQHVQQSNHGATFVSPPPMLARVQTELDLSDANNNNNNASDEDDETLLNNSSLASHPYSSSAQSISSPPLLARVQTELDLRGSESAPEMARDPATVSTMTVSAPPLLARVQTELDMGAALDAELVHSNSAAAVVPIAAPPLLARVQTELDMQAANESSRSEQMFTKTAHPPVNIAVVAPPLLSRIRTELDIVDGKPAEVDSEASTASISASDADSDTECSRARGNSRNGGIQRGSFNGGKTSAPPASIAAVPQPLLQRMQTELDMKPINGADEDDDDDVNALADASFNTIARGGNQYNTTTVAGVAQPLLSRISTDLPAALNKHHDIPAPVEDKTYLQQPPEISETPQDLSIIPTSPVFAQSNLNPPDEATDPLSPFNLSRQTSEAEQVAGSPIPASTVPPPESRAMSDTVVERVLAPGESSELDNATVMDVVRTHVPPQALSKKMPPLLSSLRSNNAAGAMLTIAEDSTSVGSDNAPPSPTSVNSSSVISSLDTYNTFDPTMNVPASPSSALTHALQSPMPVPPSPSSRNGVATISSPNSVNSSESPDPVTTAAGMTPSTESSGLSMQAMRAKVESELLSSEETYVENLGVLVHQFIHPLKMMSDFLGITIAQIGMMFSNVELLYNFHCIFLQDLKKAIRSSQAQQHASEQSSVADATSPSSTASASTTNAIESKRPSIIRSPTQLSSNISGFNSSTVTSPVNEDSVTETSTTRKASRSSADATKVYTVAEIILKVADFLKMTGQYLNGYTLALDTIASLRSNVKFQQFLLEKRQANKQSGAANLDLMSYLILPVQRIPRYLLLLAELLKRTPKNHPELTKLQEAYQKVQKIAIHVNESQRHVENMSVLLSIQNSISAASSTSAPAIGQLMMPHRRLIRKGVLNKLTSGLIERMHPRKTYLFNDLLLWCEPAAESSNTSAASAATPPVGEKFRGMLELDGLSVREYFGKGNRVGFRLSSRKSTKDTIFVCANTEEKKAWLEDLRNAIQVVLEVAEEARKRRLDMRIRNSTIKVKEANERRTSLMHTKLGEDGKPAHYHTLPSPKNGGSIFSPASTIAMQQHDSIPTTVSGLAMHAAVSDALKQLQEATTGSGAPHVRQVSRGKLAQAFSNSPTPSVGESASANNTAGSANDTAATESSANTSGSFTVSVTPSSAAGATVAAATAAAPALRGSVSPAAASTTSGGSLLSPSALAALSTRNNAMRSGSMMVPSSSSGGGGIANALKDSAAAAALAAGRSTSSSINSAAISANAANQPTAGVASGVMSMPAGGKSSLLAALTSAPSARNSQLVPGGLGPIVFSSPVVSSVLSGSPPESGEIGSDELEREVSSRLDEGSVPLVESMTDEEWMMMQELAETRGKSHRVRASSF